MAENCLRSLSIFSSFYPSISPSVHSFATLLELKVYRICSNIYIYRKSNFQSSSSLLQISFFIPTVLFLEVSLRTAIASLIRAIRGFDTRLFCKSYYVPITRKLSAKEYMASPSVIRIDFKILLNEILQKLNLPPAIYGCVLEDEFFKSYVEIKPFPRDGDSVTYWGFSTSTTRAENVAVRSAINFLKFNHNFLIEDDNFKDMQIYKLNSERFESAFEELRQEYVDLKKKLDEIEGNP